MASWIWFDDGPLPGESNMAADMELWRRAESGAESPVLRLYGWREPTLSLGYFQKPEEALNLDLCRARGIAVVRRPTGGRALFHDRELTYALVAPTHHPAFAGGLKATHQAISAALVLALGRLGISADAARAARPAGPPARSPACFASLNHCEITVDGRKLVGSAQKRGRHAFLQHGSLVIDDDPGRWLDLLRFPDEMARTRCRERLRDSATCLNRLRGRPLERGEVASAVLYGFQQAFSGEWREGRAGTAADAGLELLSNRVSG